MTKPCPWVVGDHNYFDQARSVEDTYELVDLFEQLTHEKGIPPKIKRFLAEEAFLSYVHSVDSYTDVGSPFVDLSRSWKGS